MTVTHQLACFSCGPQKRAYVFDSWIVYLRGIQSIQCHVNYVTLDAPKINDRIFSFLWAADLTPFPTWFAPIPGRILFDEGRVVHPGSAGVSSFLGGHGCGCGCGGRHLHLPRRRLHFTRSSCPTLRRSLSTIATWRASGRSGS